MRVTLSGIAVLRTGAKGETVLVAGAVEAGDLEDRNKRLKGAWRIPSKAPAHSVTGVGLGAGFE